MRKTLCICNAVVAAPFATWPTISKYLTKKTENNENYFNTRLWVFAIQFRFSAGPKNESETSLLTFFLGGNWKFQGSDFAVCTAQCFLGMVCVSGSRIPSCVGWWRGGQVLTGLSWCQARRPLLPLALGWG